MNGARERTIRDLVDRVANPDSYAGGGAIASASLAGAAATAGLVFVLSARRRRITDQQRLMLIDLAETAERQRAFFLDAIQHDIDVLGELMDAMKQSQRNPDQAARLVEAARAAIDVPMSVAQEGLRLLHSIEEARPFARFFTMSDLAAAAATANGALTAMLMMARANLELLDSHEESSRRRKEIDQLATTAGQFSQRIVDSIVVTMDKRADERSSR